MCVCIVARVAAWRAAVWSARELGPSPILGSSVGCLGPVGFSSENLLVSSGLSPLGLTWGEPFGGSGL